MESDENNYYKALGLIGLIDGEQILRDENCTRELMDGAEKKNAELADEIQNAKSIWLRFLVTTNSVLCGILVSLGNNSLLPRHIRILYASGAFLLILSILLLSASLYSGLYYSRQKRRLYNAKAGKTIQEGSLPRSVYVPKRALFSILEVSGYICFVLALLALGLYTLLSAFL